MRIDTSEKLKKVGAANPDVKTRILVSMGTCGIAAGTTPVLEAINKEVEALGLKREIEVVQSGCMGLCHSEPTIEIVDVKSENSVIFGNVKPEDANAIVTKGGAASGIDIIEKNWYYPELEDNPGKAIQYRIVLKNCGRIDPEDINEYIANDGYTALLKVLKEMKPANVIDVIDKSGLRGRGGGGFPTGAKWKFAATQKSDIKYVICNADEGDPGAFMDRAVLEGDPHSVLEAMIIAGYAVGAHNGVIYVRAEYPLAVKRLYLAVDEARKCGFLGEKIFNSGFNFDIDIKYGAGAFVCGEETALIHSIEGHRGEPTFKPPYPAISGLWKEPTVVNNVETYANVCAIIRKGPDWFKSIGTEKSPGTKVFALAGKINKVGLIEVPMGTSLNDIIYKLGQGIKDGKAFKAVQTGGPSGGCITSKSIDTKIDYETLKSLGSMMGSGGMIVLDEDDCMVNVARYFLEFTLDESCGKCTPCRIGNKRLHEMLVEICSGNGTELTLKKLKDLSLIIKDTALCGLGQTSPNPVLSTMANFMDEYIAHVKDKKCPAMVCRKLIRYEISDKCVGCGVCAKNCPSKCISGEKKNRHLIDQSKCIRCGVCRDVCKFNAVEKK
ncbi:MAG: NADH dehydrogenase [Lentisphaerae bacterium GWF2_44_16]|nr:MAG: NADH dehydrogenase [Lentisphaerae bacterium GWF2_44_16]